jgi:hypothetical protein
MLEFVSYVVPHWITETFATHQVGWFDILKPLRCFADSRR